MKYRILNRSIRSARHLVILCILIPIACVWLSGCSDDDDKDFSDYDKYNAVGLCSAGGYDVPQAQYLTNAMYGMLGMLDEYYTSRPSWYSPNKVEKLSSYELIDYF